MQEQQSKNFPTDDFAISMSCKDGRRTALRKVLYYATFAFRALSSQHAFFSRLTTLSYFERQRRYQYGYVSPMATRSHYLALAIDYFATPAYWLHNSHAEVPSIE